MCFCAPSHVFRSKKAGVVCGKRLKVVSGTDEGFVIYYPHLRNHRHSQNTVTKRALEGSYMDGANCGQFLSFPDFSQLAFGVHSEALCSYSVILVSIGWKGPDHGLQ